MKIKIETDGTCDGTKITDAETGERLKVSALKIDMNGLYYDTNIQLAYEKIDNIRYCKIINISNKPNI